VIDPSPREPWDDLPPNFDDEIAALDERGNGSVTASTPTTTRLRLLNDVELMALEDPDWLVEDVLPRRGVVCWVGPPGAYKTTSIAGVLLDIATARPWFGHRVRYPGKSLYVGAEDPSGFKLRLAAAKRAAGLSLTQVVGVYTYPDAIDLRDMANVGRFIGGVQAHGVAFETVVVDTYAASTPGSAENSSEDTTAAMAAAQQIRDGLASTLVLIHHTNASGTRERGHSAMRGAADAMIMLEPVDDVVHVRCEKQRNGTPFETLTLKPVPATGGGLVLRLAADVLPSTTLTPLQTQVLEALKDIAGRDGQTKTAWRAACSSVSERAFYKVANLLVDRGYVAQIGTHFRLGVKR
jgi:hypothetical protein